MIPGLPLYFSKEENRASGEGSSIRCDLCPHRCLIGPGKTGLCSVRRNHGGEPSLPWYGIVTATASDPIEKKPLYHFRPGTEIFSIGFAGCNLRCPFCQNWHISQIKGDNEAGETGKGFSPVELIAAVLKNFKSPDKAAIAYTYSEPLVHMEFLLDCMREARKAGAANVIVSNGCVKAEAAEAVLSLTDAANIDLKCFSEETYSKVLGGDLGTVKNFIYKAAEKNVHLELTTLVVPGLNDSEEELDQCADFINGLEKTGKTIPWHLSAYHPAWKWNTPSTQPRLLTAAAKRAREKVSFVYTGNIPVHDEKNFCDTHCPHCGAILVSRRGYSVNTTGLVLDNKNGKLCYLCKKCGKNIPVNW